MADRLSPMLATHVTWRSQAQVTQFFDGTELLPPGVVIASKWRPESDLEARVAAAPWARRRP